MFHYYWTWTLVSSSFTLALQIHRCSVAALAPPLRAGTGAGEGARRLTSVSKSASVFTNGHGQPSGELVERRTVISDLIAKNALILTSASLALPSTASAESDPTGTAESSSSTDSSTSRGTIENRLYTTAITMPPSSFNSNGIDNLYYPSWLEGEWDVQQTLVDTATPLGIKYVGGPNGSESIALESIKEQNKQLNIPVSLRFRYVKTKFGVAEDRLYNTRQRLDAFAGRSVVSSVDYADVSASNRVSVLSQGGTKDDPLQTTVVRFKGPAAQKSFLIAHASDKEQQQQQQKKFVAHEVVRSIFALTNTNTAPPVTTDVELIWSFEQQNQLDGNKDNNDTVRGKLRIASYLNSQSDKLYFEAKNRAVSFADYDLVMKRIS